MGTRITAGAGPRAVGAPAHQRQLIVNLVHGRPDVVEELDLDHRLHAAHGVADGAAHDVGLGQRRVEDPLGAEFGLQAGGELEDAALALDFGERFLAAGVGHVLAIDHDARIAAHLVVQAGVDKVGHGARAASLGAAALSPAGGARRLRLFGGKGRAGGVQVLGVDVRRRFPPPRAAEPPRRARRPRRPRGPLALRARRSAPRSESPRAEGAPASG